MEWCPIYICRRLTKTIIWLKMNDKSFIGYSGAPLGK
jgi:hypothetical protein